MMLKSLIVCLGLVLGQPAPTDPPAATPTEPARDVASYNLREGGVALDGYDPVAYFPEGGGKALRGDPAITSTHRGVTCRFASAQHRSLFEKTPARYEPAYGGWCAAAMAKGGRKVGVDPTNFKVHNDRLFLFYRQGGSDALRDFWVRDEAAHTRDADGHWKRLTGEDPPPPAEPTGPRDLTHFLLGPGGLAIQGYDPVAYFPAHGGRAAKGDAKFEVEHRGVRYRFASEENRRAFLASPGAYEPAYGGWCATAMCEGRKVKIDPRSFKVTGGRLFLFYTNLFSDARSDWVKDEAASTAKADERWKRLTGP
jgi:YHS domain-containing protein